MAEQKRPDEDRLSTPGRRRSFQLPRRLRFNEEAFGKFAEWIARYMGSPSFLIWMSVFIAIWIVWNSARFLGSFGPPVPVTRLVAGPVVSPGRLAGLPTTTL